MVLNRLLFLSLVFGFCQFGNAIINGIQLSRSVYPQVMPSEEDCTVSLVGPRTIVTSAHCVTSDRFKVAGQWVKMHIHPDFWMDTMVESFDIAIGVLPKEIRGIQPLPFCSSADTESWLEQTVAQIGYGCNYRGGAGGGVKRYGFTKVDRVEKDFMRFDAGSNGAVGCNGDSGGPYLVRNQVQKSSCVLAIHFDSNLSRFNMATNVFYSRVRDWIQTVAREKDLSICGINADCTSVYYPLR